MAGLVQALASVLALSVNRQRKRPSDECRSMTKHFRPAADWELANIVADAAIGRSPLEILGSGTKQSMGRPAESVAQVSLRGLSGVMLYEPSELVMGVRAGTLLADVESQLAQRGQMLAFEPLDMGALLGKEAGFGTIGAVFATNLSGARRLSAGAARDHLIGTRAVTGHGRIVLAGGRVMKNVTGYDVSRGLAGSWGTLAVMTEVTFKEIGRAHV